MRVAAVQRERRHRVPYGEAHWVDGGQHAGEDPGGAVEDLVADPHRVLAVDAGEDVGHAGVGLRPGIPLAAFQIGRRASGPRERLGEDQPPQRLPVALARVFACLADQIVTGDAWYHCLPAFPSGGPDADHFRDTLRCACYSGNRPLGRAFAAPARSPLPPRLLAAAATRTGGSGPVSPPVPGPVAALGACAATARPRRTARPDRAVRRAAETIASAGGQEPGSTPMPAKPSTPGSGGSARGSSSSHSRVATTPGGTSSKPSKKRSTCSRVRGVGIPASVPW